MKLMIVAAFLIVTIGLMLIQPHPTPNQLAGDEDELTEMTKSAALIDAPSATYSNSESAVTRSETKLLSVGGAARSEDVSKLLRQPIRLNGSSRDIRALSSDVLAKFGYSVGADDRLHGLLVQALAEGQSGAYIYALLNSVLTRGDFRAPSRIDDVMGPFQYGCFASRADCSVQQLN